MTASCGRDELLDETGAPYYLYCTVEAKPGYVFRSGTGTLKYANEEWKPGKWAEAIWDDDWTGHGQHQRRRVL